MSHITTCPNCSTRLRVSEQITDKTLICPRCLADVDNPQPGFQIRFADIDTDVKRGLSVGTIVLAALIGLSIIGVTMSHLYLYGRFGKPSDPQGLAVILFMFSFFSLDVLVSIAIVRGLIRWGISGDRVPSVGRVLGIVFLSLGTVVAVVIFLFFTCLALITDKV